VAVACKLLVLLHCLWVSAEVYEPLYNVHRRAEQQAAWRGSRIMEQRSYTEEVKIPQEHRAATLKSGGWPRLLCPRWRFGSSEVTAPSRTWSTLIKEERPIGRLQRQGLVRKDESHPMHRVAKESELIESGDGSMARGTAVEFGHDSRHGSLTECAFSWKFVTASNAVATPKIVQLGDVSPYSPMS
jgi:hypothetical protein